MKKRLKKRNDSFPMFDKKTEDEDYKWYKAAQYCKLVLKCFIAFILGIVFSKILQLL